MINVDIFVPAMNQTYNFNVDECAKIRDLVDDISELICKKEHSVLGGDREQLVLGSMDLGEMFQETHSLAQYDIRNGSKLILV